QEEHCPTRLTGISVMARPPQAQRQLTPILQLSHSPSLRPRPIHLHQSRQQQPLTQSSFHHRSRGPLTIHGSSTTVQGERRLSPTVYCRRDSQHLGAVRTAMDTAPPNGAVSHGVRL